MADYSWPEASKRRYIGKSVSRLDGPLKVTGVAKYSYDVNRSGMLFARILRCPHAHARITGLDTSAAEAVPGVKAVRVIQGVGTEIKWELDEIATVAAETEEAAEDGVRAIKVDYEVLSHFVTEEDRASAPDQEVAREETEGDPAGAMASADVRSKGYYGIAAITHCCMESHGQVCEWEGEDKLNAWCSTQAVSGLPGQFADKLGLPTGNVRVITPYMGGGFGSKFSADRWGIECAELARQENAAVKLFLERDAELAVAGDRPSAYAEIEVGAKSDGTIVAWSSETWGSGGISGSRGSPPVPYVFQVPNRKQTHHSIVINKATARAWRAPNHPQACFLTMGALEDLAAELKMDPLDLFLKNVSITGPRADTYAEELEVGAALMDWRRNWHPRGDSGRGPVKRGLGLGLHTWGGRAHQSNCEVVIFPDGNVEARLGSQDLGTGTITVVAMILAETLDLPLDAVSVKIGDSRFPASGGSGGSTTVGGVTSSTRRAAVNALEQLLERVAPSLDASADQLEAVDGRVQVKGNPARSLSWRQAAARIGPSPMSATGSNPGPGKLSDSGVGGIQMADVSVDVETGIVKINKVVAVQDCGLIIDMKLSESQVYGSLIMGIAYALCEEKVLDPVSGKMLNPDMEFYKLPGIGDIGELVVHMMTGPGYDERGVIGLGEPPVISTGAAIANAVANAIGVRVPYMPVTPNRVLEALERGGAA